jgi:hypothetical protein
MALRIWRDFGSALSFQTCLTQAKLSNERGSQVKDQGLRQCCHNKHKKFSYRPTHDVSLLSGHASYCTYHTTLAPLPLSSHVLLIGHGTGQHSWYSNSLQAGKSEDQIPVWARLSAPIQTDSGVHSASCTMGNASISEE